MPTQKTQNNDDINKDVIYKMMLNALSQITDGINPDDVCVNPDMENYDDFNLKETLELAKQYEEVK